MSNLAILRKALIKDPWDSMGWLALADACEEAGSFVELADMLIGLADQVIYAFKSFKRRVPIDKRFRMAACPEGQIHQARLYLDRARVFFQAGQRAAPAYGKPTYYKRLESLRVAIGRSERMLNKGIKHYSFYGTSYVDAWVQHLAVAMMERNLVERRS